MLDGSETKSNIPAIPNLSTAQRKNSSDDSVFECSKNEKADINYINYDTNFEFVLSSSREFHDPIMGLDLVDLTSDSLKELVVMTMNGVHILQVIFIYLEAQFLFTDMNIFYLL